MSKSNMEQDPTGVANGATIFNNNLKHTINKKSIIDDINDINVDLESLNDELKTPEQIINEYIEKLPEDEKERFILLMQQTNVNIPVILDINKLEYEAKARKIIQKAKEEAKEEAKKAKEEYPEFNLDEEKLCEIYKNIRDVIGDCEEMCNLFYYDEEENE